MLMKNLCSHADLVVIARRWLRNQMNCPLVLTEMSVSGCEVPDAIGFRNDRDHWWQMESILIECKVSRNDLRLDQAKSFRLNPDKGMGVRRYLLAPCGVFDEALINDVLAENHWGYLEWDGRSVFQRRRSDRLPANKDAELVLMMSAIRRLKVQGDGVSVKCYIDGMYKTKMTPTLTMEPDENTGSVRVGEGSLEEPNQTAEVLAEGSARS